MASLQEMLERKRAAAILPPTTPIALAVTVPPTVESTALTGTVDALVADIVKQSTALADPTVLVPPSGVGIPATSRILPSHEDIVPRIRALEALALESLDDEMKLLKEALLQNPSAVSLMLPEDVGLLVSALRRITGEAIANEESGKASKKKVKLTAEELTAAFEEL